MAKKNALTLRITGPDGAIMESSSELPSVILGSGAGAAVKLSDPKVSNLHVLLRVEGNGMVTAIDLGSEHGTRVGDRLIRDPVSLSSGDSLFLGGTEVKVLLGEEGRTPIPGNGAFAPGLREVVKPRTNLVKGLAGTGQNAALLFNEPLSAEATPLEDSKILQIALLWGDTLINVEHVGDGVPVTIGEGRHNLFHVYSPSVGDSFTLAESDGSTLTVNVPSSAGLVVASGSSHKSKEQLRSEGRLGASDEAAHVDAIEVGLHDRVQVSFENVAFILRYVRPSAAVPAGSMVEQDFTFFKIASICMLAFFAVVAVFLLTPVPEAGTSDDVFANPSKYVKLLVKPEKKPELAKKLSGIQEGAKPKAEEGRFGKEESKRKDADPSRLDARKREDDLKKVMSAGLLGAMANGAASNIFQPGGLGTGINDALGGLKSAAGPGDAHGVGGLGARGGQGSGGGGTSLGLGGVGTKGAGSGPGGYGLIDLGGRGKDVVRVIPGKTTVVGGLDKDVIAKIIRRHQNEIRYCYEQELNKDPNLAGKVGVQFVIDPTGSVSDASVSETTLANANTESCMLARIRRWKFPEPKGGGIVTVTFPWIFKPAGSSDE
ncbi:MAG TPA: AgmX/PglI C-terminal domain-containing protein [Myxococcaceae bacterium]|nr:AgmX/PglI C-terminal domain-containing protein [Myxococcaceae bacterium]